MLEVLEGGLATTVQDGGRKGLYELGIPPSGAMDDFSLRAANLLVGNPEEAAALEVVYLGPKLRFTDERVVAVTGAAVGLKVDGQVRPTWEALEVGEGQELSFSFPSAGARAYLGVSGTIDVPEALGSRSTYARIALGGYEGRTLAEGDRLPLGETPMAASRCVGRRVDEALRPGLEAEAEIRISVGLFAHRLTDESLEAFLSAQWQVTADADRVGYRYTGAELEFVERDSPFGVGPAPWNVSSVNYPLGVIQVPGGVEPIVLMNDGVTGGNYATVGAVISADRDRVAQTKTHEKTRFRQVSLEEALEARAERGRRLDRLREGLAAAG